ncbi:hypothetical protein VIS19158_11793 [Vibrio scophthalmi LMG 19158]|uniref:Uncharacterized protein n=1 Tax=Vibrio scophthalmi LMG 19158 TaxID=870967 RepID=F9RIE6_9VIBR|nr:hypothetical protein VIS19158_11793 [Vibrio scophthalmi LMG 19158]
MKYETKTTLLSKVSQRNQTFKMTDCPEIKPKQPNSVAHK